MLLALEEAPRFREAHALLLEMAVESIEGPREECGQAMKSRGAMFVVMLVLFASLSFAQRRSRRYSDGPIYYSEGGVPVDVRVVKTAREIASHSTGTPDVEECARI